MAKCKYCGAEVESKYCPYCGVINREFIEEEKARNEENEKNIINPKFLSGVKKVVSAVVETGKTIIKTVKENIAEDNKIKFCKNCGRKLKEDSLFCDKCGSNFSEEE